MTQAPWANMSQPSGFSIRDLPMAERATYAPNTLLNIYECDLKRESRQFNHLVAAHYLKLRRVSAWAATAPEAPGGSGWLQISSMSKYLWPIMPPGVALQKSIGEKASTR